MFKYFIVIWMTLLMVMISFQQTRIGNLYTQMLDNYKLDLKQAKTSVLIYENQLKIIERINAHETDILNLFTIVNEKK